MKLVPRRPSARLCASILAAAVFVCASPARAEGAKRKDRISCIDLAVVDSNAATLEWAFWLWGGALFPDHATNPGAAGGLGGELTFQLLTYEGFPSGYERFEDAELRLGPWIAGGLRDGGAFGEGGIKATLGAVRFMRFGVFDLRAGAGYGELPGENATHLTAGLGWGIRTARGRYTTRGYCDPPARPKSLTEASLLRFVFSYRRALAAGSGDELGVSLELSPTFFLPPTVCEHFVVH